MFFTYTSFKIYELYLKCFILFFQPVTHHGVGKKLGGGKGSIKYYGTPVRAGRVILEVGGNVYWEEVRPWLNRICKMFSFEVS